MSTFYQLDFERPVIELEREIDAAERAGDPAGPATGIPAFGGVADAAGAALTPADIAALRAKREKLLVDLYTKLSPWDTVRVARHPNRPQTRDYIGMICRDFCELHGDRRFGDDPAIVTGFGRIGSLKCLIVGHQKGKSTQEKLACHFGCAHPEGYRKALAKMKLAEKYGLPVVTLVDTPGAYPGLGAEQRGQAEAIAVNMREMAVLRTPVVSVVIGEGGSGGALGIAVADRVAMLQHAWYSVISPEGCAAILWKQANEQTNHAAATALKLTARDNLELGIVDAIVPEPVGGAHRDPHKAAASLERWILDQLTELRELNPDVLVERRYDRFRKLGSFTEQAPEPAPSTLD
jgi:acetyl-CoA carboxylase carboxyl transferase subunit alpha